MNYRAKRAEKGNQRVINSSSSAGYNRVSGGKYSDNTECMDNDSSSLLPSETNTLLSSEVLSDLNLSKETGDIDCTVICSPSDTSPHPTSDTKDEFD
jgi:hypothetical protein